jgi:beta-galactosidase/beta-glucuronidase
LKKIIVVLAVLGGMISTQSVLASDKSLSRSCLKNNPLAVGETDVNLIEIYDAYCDKKNADVKYSYLAKAAQRFQLLGKNWKALQIVNELESLNLRGNTITDVKFLASANLANEALNQMRTTENRYLTTDVTYPTAKVLSENIDSAKSSIILQLEKPKVATRNTTSNTRNTSRTNNTRTTRTATTPRVTNTTPRVTTTPTTTPRVTPTPAPASSGGSPFGFAQQ